MVLLEVSDKKSEDLFIKVPAKNNLSLNARRLLLKLRLRGVSSTLKRCFENLLVRKQQVVHLCNEHITHSFTVQHINSEKTRKILIDNAVDLLILTSTPIIKPILIDIDGLTILNAHTGWLPAYRGLDANLKALKDGHQPGVTIHKVVNKIDAGEIYLRSHFSINSNGNLLRQMDEKELKLAGKLLVRAINLKKENRLKPIAFLEPLGRYEPPLSKREKEVLLRKLTLLHH